mgnify:CR=1 FL=1|tara:strand:+ start:577 stop:1329 length:753 start_codon:yes stop_codon:yes gene_type:complete
MTNIEKYYDHLSASTINLFVRDKAKFILKTMKLDDFNGNPSTIRGQAVDHQLCSIPFYKDKNIQTHIEEASSFYESELLGLKGKFEEKKIEKERSDLPQYIMSGFPTYYNLDDLPVRTQSKITVEFEEVSLPIIGYIDLELETTLRELKSVRAIPSAIPHAVQRQASIYSYATKKPIWVDYTSKKNCTSYKVINVEDNIKEVIQICQSIEKFLSISKDIHEIAGMFYPNLDSWEWDKNDINTAKKIWSIK